MNNVAAKNPVRPRKNPAKKFSFPFRRKNQTRANLKSKELFFFLGLPRLCEVLAERYERYDLVSSHHALRASHLLVLKKPLSSVLVRSAGIGPAPIAWEAIVLPLNYDRDIFNINSFMP